MIIPTNLYEADELLGPDDSLLLANGWEISWFTQQAIWLATSPAYPGSERFRGHVGLWLVKAPYVFRPYLGYIMPPVIKTAEIWGAPKPPLYGKWQYDSVLRIWEPRENEISMRAKNYGDLLHRNP